MPVFLLVLLFKVTGIPETEAQSLRSRGDDYRRYQDEVSVFVPLPPRRKHGGDVIADRVVARGILPDPLLRAAIAQNCRLRLRRERRRGLDALEEMVAAMSDGPDRDRDAARPTTSTTSFRPQFFALALGPRRKYSGCFWPDGVETLADAEETMLALTCARAGIVDGMDVLDLGCGWGSLSGWIAETLPVVPDPRRLELGPAEGIHRRPRPSRISRS